MSEPEPSDSESSDGAPLDLPSLSSRVLQLSTLLWEWKGTRRPTTVHVSDGPDERPLGRYSAGPTTPIALDLDSPWSPEHSAFVYNLPEAQAPLTLRYTRRAFVGGISTEIVEYGTIAGVYSQGGADSETIGPKLCVHHADEDPFPETLEPEEGIDLKRGPGPPFDFIDFDWIYDGVPPDGIGRRTRALNVNVPDLPGQSENDIDEPRVKDMDDEDDDDDDSDDYVEEDDSELYGWSGDWVRTLLEQRERGEDVETRTEVKWYRVGRVVGGNWTDSKLWGAEIDFEDFEEHRPYRHNPAGRRYLKGYTVVATVRRVFIAPEWFTDRKDE